MLDRTNRIVVVMMMTMAMTTLRVSMVSDGLSVGFVTMLMAFVFLFVAVGASTVFVVFSEMGMLVEESHSDNIDDKSYNSNDDHLARVYNRRVIDSLKGFNEDIETDKNEEDSLISPERVWNLSNP